MVALMHRFWARKELNKPLHILSAIAPEVSSHLASSLCCPLALPP